MRETSLEAYTTIVESGALGRQRCDVLRALVHCEPATSGEIAAALPGYDNPRHTVSRRLPELRDVGVIQEHDPRECKSLGTRQIVWSVTGRLPEPRPKAATRAEMVRELVALRAEVVRLKAALPKQMRLL